MNKIKKKCHAFYGNIKIDEIFKFSITEYYAMHIITYVVKSNKNPCRN